MSFTEILVVAIRLGSMLAGLLLPGTVLLRVCRLPWSLAGSFVSSCVLIYVSVVGCTVVHAPISVGTLAIYLAMVSAGGLFFVRRRGGGTGRDEATAWAFLTSLRGWTPLYVVFWVIVVYRLGTDPLSGPDVHFRWSYLAEQMLRFGSLDFYPPQYAEDLVRYFWPESIPPGIASVYAWAYGCGGSHQALWTSPVVALQLLSLHDLVWRLAYRHGGATAARFAVLLAAGCPLLTWSFLIGQETGLLTVAVCGMVWCLDRPGTSTGTGWTVLAGVFAIAAASTREYGFVYALAAVGVAALVPATRGRWLILAAVALPVVAVWPARVWVRTGNPFFSLDLAGLFPVNAAFVSWNDSFRAAQQNTLSSAAGWFSLARYLVLWALPGCLGLLALVTLLFRRASGAVLATVFAALAAGLWTMSVAYTAGGLFYSLRVLAPAFALLLVAASRLGGSLARAPAFARGLAAALLLLSLEALPKTLVLPDNPYRVPVREWADASRRITLSFHGDEPEVAAKLVRLPGRRRVISDGFDLPNLAVTLGFEVAPPWSPEVDWLFDPKMEPAAAARHWQATGLRFLIVGRTGAMLDYLQTHARMNTPYYHIERADETSAHFIFEVIPTGVPVPP